MRRQLPLVLSVARLGVGVALTAWPERLLRNDDAANGTSAFLLRTIGIRDLVLGGGAVFAWSRGRDDFRRWALAGTVSDIADLVAALTGTRLLGRGGAAQAAAIVAPWVAAGVAGLRPVPKG
jgi:2-methylisocitrate lyase-like PEP mutase family enzyme